MSAAQTFEVLHVFSNALGAPSSTLVEADGGLVYGTTQTGGVFGLGSVFALVPRETGGYDFVELHAFSGPDGANPEAGVTRAPDGSLWGTAVNGGAHEAGTVFSITPKGHLTVMHQFSGPDGKYPVAGLTPTPNGSFLGVTREVDGGGGSIFKIGLDGHFESLHFFGGWDGISPVSTLVRASDGAYYGTAMYGGYDGTVFRIDEVGNFTRLHTFQGDGMTPRGGLVQGADGYLYGTTVGGGASHFGVVFRMDFGGNTTVIHDFDGALALNPLTGLVQVAPNVFRGMTASGGTAGQGVIFQIEPNGVFTMLHSFDGSDGATPLGALSVRSDGALLGTTAAGGSQGLGTVFQLDPGNTLSTLSDFQADISGPFSALVQATDGSLYGATAWRGNKDFGSIFRSDLSGVVSSVYGSPTLGIASYSGSLIQASDERLYGSSYDPSGNTGRIFSVGLDGDFRLMRTLTPDEGLALLGGLAEGGDGWLYGTARFGGSSGLGTIFRIDTDANFELLHTFTGTDGSEPCAAPIQAADGNLYGTTFSGGSEGGGTAFRVDAAGNVGSIHSFVYDEGVRPSASFAPASDGTLLGSATIGGANTAGTLFKMSLEGNVTPFHAFVVATGWTPDTTLLAAGDGSFFGTTLYGGQGEPPWGHGTVFRVDPNGNVETVHEFTGGPGGGFPCCALTQASDGNFYGVAGEGIGNRGVIYRLLANPPETTLDSISPSSGRAQGGTSIQLAGIHFRPGMLISIGDAPATGIVEVDYRAIRSLSPILVPGKLYDVVLSTSDGAEPATLPDGWFADFLDVPSSQPFHDAIEEIVRSGLTAGCGNGNYCPDSPVTRAQSAVFLLKAAHGPDYTPPACQGLFGDVACPSQFADWIEQLAAEGITGGCGGANFCPASLVTREQIAVLLLKTKHGPDYEPPVCSGIFTDVQCPSTYAAWIEALYDENVTAGCSSEPRNYCPGDSVSRGQHAVFLSNTFKLQ